MLVLYFVLVILCVGTCTADERQELPSSGEITRRTTRATKHPWPIQCLYTSMINQDKTWYMYRPILDCCYRCRQPYYACLTKTPHWFCYREAFACSSKCVVKSHWHGENFPKSTDQIMQNFPLSSYYTKNAPASSTGQRNHHQSSPARRPKLPCVGRVCFGDLCFFSQLCYKISPRYLKNVPV